MKDSRFTDFLYNFSVFKSYVEKIRARDRFNSDAHKNIMKFLQDFTKPEMQGRLKKAGTTGKLVCIKLLNDTGKR